MKLILKLIDIVIDAILLVIDIIQDLDK